MQRLRIPLLLVIGWVAGNAGACTCQSSPTDGTVGMEPREKSTGPSGAAPLAKSPPRAEPRERSTGGPKSTTSAQPVPCQTDADCPPLACGPCTPGEIITTDGGAVSCTINPCLDARAVCGPAGACVVNAEARKNPAVWCRKCWELEHDAPKLCGAKSPTGKSMCEQTLADAVAKCDDGACEATRSALMR